MRTTRLRVRLQGVEPPVLRVLDVPADTLLPELHDLLQAALGWTNSHLHEFLAGGRRYGVPDEDAPESQLDESRVRLSSLGPRFVYGYDFGDGWKHDVEVLGQVEDESGLRYGEGACPPEDCGGPGGYADLRRAVADAAHPEHAAVREWLGGDLPEFDEAGTARRVRDALGAVPESVRLVLDLVAAAPAGVRLTPGGRLPRAFVREVQARRPEWEHFGRPAHLEEDLLPLLELHALLRAAGLLRLSRGVLSATKAARSGDLEIVRRLRARFPAGTFGTVLAEGAIAHLEVHGPTKLDDLAVAVLPRLGFGWMSGGNPLTAYELRFALLDDWAAWAGLDLIRMEDRVWHAGPSARTLLPGVATLVHLARS